MKVVFFTEDIAEPFDEGIKKTVLYIINEIKKNNDLYVFGKYVTKNSKIAEEIKGNRLLLNKKLWKKIKNISPNAIIYLPSSSGRSASFVRTFILSHYEKNAKSILIILQPKKISTFLKILLKIYHPDLILSPSPKVLAQFFSLGLNIKFLPLPVDTKKFKPVENLKIKNELRKKYNIPVDKFVLTHVGHINWGRNLKALIPLQSQDNQVVVVGSSSTPIDAPKEIQLKKKLIEVGIIIIDSYIENIEEIYQLSDIYIFPVTYEVGSIGMPLSVLEARACGIPVLTTDFGSIQDSLGSDFGSIFYGLTSDFNNIVSGIKKSNSSFTNSSIDKINLQFIKVINTVLQD